MYTKNTKLSEVAANPKAAEAFRKHGLGCMGCMLANFETVAEGCMAHGLDVDEILKDLNEIEAQD